MELKIDPDFRDLLSPLAKEEFEALEASILKDGVEDPIKTWNGYIVDGHNRYRICTAHGIKDFPIREKHFDNKSDAMNWIIENQKGRRNLTLSQLVVCYSKVEEQMAKEAKERQRQSGGDRKSEEAKSVRSNLTQPIENTGQTAEKIAEKIGISKNTYKAAKTVVAKGTDEEIKRLDKGGKGNGAQRIATEIKARETGITEKECSKCHKVKPIAEFNPSGENGNFKSYCISCEHEMKNKNRKKETQADLEVAKKLNLEQFHDTTPVTEIPVSRKIREVMATTGTFLDSIRAIADDEFDHNDEWKTALCEAAKMVVEEFAKL